MSALIRLRSETFRLATLARFRTAARATDRPPGGWRRNKPAFAVTVPGGGEQDILDAAKRQLGRAGSGSIPARPARSCGSDGMCPHGVAVFGLTSPDGGDGCGRGAVA